jgi:hypothetical protein
MMVCVGPWPISASAPILAASPMEPTRPRPRTLFSTAACSRWKSPLVLVAVWHRFNGTAKAARLTRGGGGAFGLGSRRSVVSLRSNKFEFLRYINLLKTLDPKVFPIAVSATRKNKCASNASKRAVDCRQHFC